MKLTPKSAHLVKKYGLRENSKTGLSTGALEGQKGQNKGFVEFTKRPRSALRNPTYLANTAASMAQFAMQQAMDETTDYLARIDEVAWPKAQAAPATIAETRAYALRQLKVLAEKVERKPKIGDLAATIREVEPEIREWLAVLARCFRLQDAIAVLLELDRVLDSSPEELHGHRLGLKAARQEQRASMPPGISATRPSTGPAR